MGGSKGWGGWGHPTGGVPPDRFGRAAGTARPAPEARAQAQVSYRSVRETPAEKPISYVPWPLRVLVRTAVTAALLAAVTIGPGYVDCRQRRDAGLMFYGMTMGACTRQATWEHVGRLQRHFDDIARAIRAQ